MKACQQVGYCRESEYPFASLYEDISGFPGDNRKPPPRAYIAGFDQRNLRYSRVYETGAERRAEAERLYRARVPLIFGMTVDRAFMGNRGSLIESIDLGDAVGGHMLTLLACEDEGPRFDNWWDEDWGYGGEGRMTWELFGSPLIRDIYAVESAPAFSSEAL